MPALKDIKGFSSFASTPLAQSVLWDRPAADIIPAQLVALRARLKLEGYDATDSLFRKVAAALDKVKQSGELAGAPILRYTEPKKAPMTSRDLRKGFEQMVRPMPAAILFALEVGIEADQVAVLTWTKLKTLKLNPYAVQILEAQPRHIGSGYIFWKQANSGLPIPLFDIELEVFEKFNMVWGELEEAYRGMVYAH